MIHQRPLTSREKAISRKNFVIYNIVNGTSYMCLGETVLILLAIQLDCSNTIVAALGSMLYIGFLLLPLGKWMTARTGAARSQAQFWVFRNIAVLVVASAVPVSLWIDRQLAEFMIILGAFLFYGFRAAGVVMSQPLIGEFCEPETKGRFIAVANSSFYLTGFITLAVIMMLLRWSENLWMLFGIIVTGAVLGITSSSFLRRIHETDRILISAREPIQQKLKSVLKMPVIEKQILAGMVCYLANIITVPISMLALKRGYSVSDSEALIFAVVQFAGTAGAGYLQSRFTDRIGARKTILTAYYAFFLTAILWCFAPAELSYWFIIFPFICGAYGYMGLINALPQYYLDTVPKELQIVSTIVISISTGAISGILGLLISSSLLKISDAWNQTGDSMQTYRFYFFMAALLILAAGFAVHRLEVVNKKPLQV